MLSSSEEAKLKAGMVQRLCVSTSEHRKSEKKKKKKLTIGQGIRAEKHVDNIYILDELLIDKKLVVGEPCNSVRGERKWGGGFEGTPRSSSSLLKSRGGSSESSSG
jgi:hypothetical protein